MDQQTVKPRDPRALNAFRHGLTGQIHILTEADQVAYDQHCRGIHESLAPVGALETDLAQSIADDRWRLKRAAAIENAMFAMGTRQFNEYDGGHPDIDLAFSQVRVWLREGKNMELMSLYEHRIQRHLEKNLQLLHELQAAREAAFEKAVEEAALLAELADSKADTSDSARELPTESLPPNFVFSSDRIARLAAHRRRLAEASKLVSPPRKPLPKAA